jgi:pimeloyl-ACP methyl ester carboxylesterase
MTKSYTCPKTGIGYKISGQGKPVLLIHGFAEDNSIWQHTRNILTDRFSWITPDLPGTGLSASIADFDHSITNHAMAMKTMLNQMDVSQFIVMGHSMGGYVALDLAQRFSAQCTGLGLLHSTCFADDDAKKANREKTISFLESYSAEAYLSTAVPGLFHQPEIDADSIIRLIKTGSKIPTHTLTAYQKMMKERIDRSYTLKSTTQPVLIIAGAQDKAVNAEQSLKQSHLAPKTDFHLLSDCAHMGMIESKERFHQILKSHLFNFHID